MTVVVAEAAANVVFDQPVQRLVGLELVLVGGFARIHAHPFIALQVLQQGAPQVRIGIEECGARELDDGDQLQRHALRARLAFDHPKALEPRGETDCDQQRDQQKGPPEKAAERERQEAPVDPHGPFLSGTSLYGTGVVALTRQLWSTALHGTRDKALKRQLWSTLGWESKLRLHRPE
ncbi:hypothetical protein R69658_03896 [Paraburkholderia aspalathi]|uniref:Uncharacterized protein n=1 Tax=Paraburkholderia aspalathi TaxID=1324617 RepID=A0ABN7LZB2_9BURK|nr:hypothetical protein R69658_03896 [Paraburkholderia aspalathi]